LMSEGFRAFLTALTMACVCSAIVVVLFGWPTPDQLQWRPNAFSPVAEADNRYFDEQTERRKAFLTRQDMPMGRQVRNGLQEEDRDMLALVVGIAAAAIYALQAYLMRETMIHANRAYLHVGIWEKHPFKDDSGTITHWRIAPRMENTGNTPTRKLRYCATNLIINAEIPPGFRFPSVGNVFSTFVGPKQYFLIADIILSVDSLITAKASHTWFYMYGWVDYDDVFFLTPRHRTEFCNRIFPYGDPSKEDCDFGYFFHSDHNGADNECQQRRRIREKIREPILKASVGSQLSAGDVIPSISEMPDPA
jgi:hypothetical protein